MAAKTGQDANKSKGLTDRERETQVRKEVQAEEPKKSEEADCKGWLSRSPSARRFRKRPPRRRGPGFFASPTRQQQPSFAQELGSRGRAQVQPACEHKPRARASAKLAG